MSEGFSNCKQNNTNSLTSVDYLEKRKILGKLGANPTPLTTASSANIPSTTIPLTIHETIKSNQKNDLLILEGEHDGGGGGGGGGGVGVGEDVDHIYASPLAFVENRAEFNLSQASTNDTNNCQSVVAESEVKFWKDWLVLHLDLIQQQSDEILDREKTILLLQQENEMLKERINCIERCSTVTEEKFSELDANSTFELLDNITSNTLDELCDNTMTQSECENKENSDIFSKSEVLIENVEEGSQIASEPNDINNYDSVSLLLNNNLDLCPAEEFEQDTTKLIVNNEKFLIEKQTTTSIKIEEIEEHFKEQSEIGGALVKIENTDQNGARFETNSDINSTQAITDPMRDLRMSIRKKRLSDSSVISSTQNDFEDKVTYQRTRKKRKRFIKDSNIHTTEEHYVTQAGDTSLDLLTVGDISSIDMTEKNNTTPLEVPRWRVKVYGSCYSMEGTENLDDEVYNKRHCRLEVDERRRKRWDVQRIREQRVVEKLKQRQDRVGSGSRIDEHNHYIHSLWPKLDNIKYLEITDHLPVSAFGCPIPKIIPSEFSLPWLANSSIMPTKRGTISKKSSIGRRRSGRR